MQADRTDSTDDSDGASGKCGDSSGSSPGKSEAVTAPKIDMLLVASTDMNEAFVRIDNVRSLLLAAQTMAADLREWAGVGFDVARRLSHLSNILSVAEAEIDRGLDQADRAEMNYAACAARRAA
jgi:hypothetical protein